MDFFKHQREAKEESAKLIVLFILGVSLVLLVTTALLLPLIHITFNVPVFEDYPARTFELTEFGFKALRAIILFVIASVGGGAFLKLTELEDGGKVIAQMLGAKRITQSGLAPHKVQEILNINEEMAIACGTRPPPLYVMSDDSINALAAGMEVRDSVIILTSGAIQELNRDEMSALVAHELAHILGGDARTNMYLTAVMHGLMMFTIMGKKLLRNVHNIRAGFPLIVFGLFLLCAGFIGSSIAGFIQSFYSQEREFLADACAVQFTRSKEGILGIFQKVWYRRFRNRLKNIYAMEVAHFLFTSTIRKNEGTTSTHPTLRERAKRIDASFRFNDYPRENYDSRKVRTLTPKQNPQSLQRAPEEFMDKILKRSSFSGDLNFSLLSFATLAITHQSYHSFKEEIQKALEGCDQMSLKLRLWLALENLNEQYAQISGAKKRHLRLPKKTHPLTYFELELVIVFSVVIAATNQNHSRHVLTLFKESFPWCQKLINPQSITPEAFFRSLNKLSALNIDSKKIVHDFIRAVIKVDGRVSYEEEEFFKLLCVRLNMTLPKE